MIINIENKEYLIETKIYYAYKQFQEGKTQLAYYCNSLGLHKGAYLVFSPSNHKYHFSVKEEIEIIENIEITTYLILYDETKWK